MEFSSHHHFYKLSCSWLLGVCRHSCLLHLACCEGFPSPLGAQGAPPSLLHVFFCCYCLLFSFFFFFSLGRSQSVQGAMLIWPRVVWEYQVPLSSPCGLHLPKPFGCCHLAAAWEPSWFLHLTWSGDAMHRLEVWRSQSFASFRWFFL
jgi:hypothetical protein